MSMTGLKLRAVIEDLDDLGLLVVADAWRGLRVKNSDGTNLGWFDLHEDGKFRSGWIERPRSSGRTDCIDWPTYCELLRAYAKKPVTR